MPARIIALVLGVVIAVGVAYVALETRYQSCIAEAEARNPVYVSVEQRMERPPHAPWRGEEPGLVQSQVEGLSDRRAAVDDC